MNGKGGDVAALKGGKKGKGGKAREAKEEKENGMAKVTSTTETTILTITSHQATLLEKASTTSIWNTIMPGATN